MYGISNSQQQGGGGGGAASYKAIKSTLTPSDWQEVAGATPYFVGDDATTWATDSNSGMHIKTNSSDLGIITGQQYTITITANGVTYSSTATAESRYGMLMLVFTFSETAAAMVTIYDHADWTAQAPGDGSAIMVNPGQNTSLVITNFEGEGFGTTIQATIADSAIKVNSAVTMYTNTSEKIAAGEKTNGSVTLTAPSVPNVIISYSLEIVGTDTEGLFELVNGYVPEIPDTPSGAPQWSVPNVIISYSLEIVGTDTEGLFELVNITDTANVPQWHTIYESSTPVIKAELSEAIQAGKLYKITISGQERIVLAIGAEHLVYSQTMLGTSNGVANSIYNNVLQFDCGIQSYDSTSTANTFKLKTASQYMINASGIQDIQFIDNDTTGDKTTFTKVEVYR